MIEIRLHGRGGQGAVTAATILARAAGYDDRYAQGFPAFGTERRGAPVKAFCRISDKPITIRSQVYEPDYVVVLDSSLLRLPEVTEGLKDNALLVINSKQQERIKNKSISYDATGIALEALGKPIVNTAMLGALAGASGLVSLESLLRAVGDVFPGKVGELNGGLVRRAYEGVKKI